MCNLFHVNWLNKTRSFFRAKMRSSNSARMNKSNFTTERKSCSVHMPLFESVVNRNVDNWIQLLT